MSSVVAECVRRAIEAGSTISDPPVMNGDPSEEPFKRSKDAADSKRHQDAATARQRKVDRLKARQPVRERHPPTPGRRTTPTAIADRPTGRPGVNGTPSGAGGAYRPPMRIAVLGPLEVRTDDGVPLTVPGAKERLLLAILTAGTPGAVSFDALAESLWDGDLPATARKSLQIHVVRLRSSSSG